MHDVCRIRAHRRTARMECRPIIFLVLYLAGTYHVTAAAAVAAATVDVVLDSDDNEDKISNMAIKMRSYQWFELIILIKSCLSKLFDESNADAHSTANSSSAHDNTDWPILSSRLILFHLVALLLV